MRDADEALGCVGVFVFLLAILLVVGGLVFQTLNFFQRDDISGTVQRVYVMHTGKVDIYHVEVRDASGQVHVLMNQDAWLFGKWDSADVQASLQEGHRYRIHTYGWRIAFLSRFPNIIRVQELYGNDY